MAGRGRPRVPRQVEREFWRKVALGLATEEAAAAVGVSRETRQRWFHDGGGMPTVELTKPTGRYLPRPCGSIRRCRRRTRRQARQIAAQPAKHLIDRFEEFRKRLEPLRSALPHDLADGLTLDAVPSCYV